MNVPLHRFFGPISETQAVEITGLILDGRHIESILIDFATDVIGPRELVYDIQVLMESTEEMLNSAEQARLAEGDMHVQDT